MEQPENIHHSVEFPDLIPFPSFSCNSRLEEYGFYFRKENTRKKVT